MQRSSQRKWLVVTTIGCAVIVAAMLVVVLALVDKPHFQSIVGPMFLPVVVSAIVAGSVVVLVGAFMLPERKTWRGIVLIVWGLIALTSPLFGIMFLLPWGVLALLLPVVITILVTLFRTSAA
jgi:hypothetical protein